MRLFAALALCAGLVACTDNPQLNSPGQFLLGLTNESPEFGVTSVKEPLPGDYDTFNKTGAALAHADAICALGFEKTGEQTVGGEPVGLLFTKGRCATYVPLIERDPFGNWVDTE